MELLSHALVGVTAAPFFHRPMKGSPSVYSSKHFCQYYFDMYQIKIFWIPSLTLQNRLTERWNLL